MSDYTSNILYHFVGRSKPTDGERFDLLVTILNGNRLIANLSNPDNPESYFQGGYRCENVGEVFGKCDCVCFCDIPDSALKIHTDKYSKFGMGFRKDFIANQGAHPVMYVPANYSIVERGDGSSKGGMSETPRTPNLYFPYLLTVAMNLLPLMEMSYIGMNMTDIQNKFNLLGLTDHVNLFNEGVRDNFFSGKRMPMIFSLLQGWGTQMAYVKLFDATLPDDHPDNYYMEREWRSLNNINFTLNDIEKIYLPNEEYKIKFIEKFPNYTGEIMIFE